MSKHVVIKEKEWKDYMAYVILTFRFQMCDRYASDLYKCMQGLVVVDYFLDEEVYIHFAGGEVGMFRVCIHIVFMFAFQP